MRYRAQDAAVVGNQICNCFFFTYSRKSSNLIATSNPNKKVSLKSLIDIGSCEIFEDKKRPSIDSNTRVVESGIFSLSPSRAFPRYLPDTAATLFFASAVVLVRKLHPTYVRRRGILLSYISLFPSTSPRCGSPTRTMRPCISPANNFISKHRRSRSTDIRGATATLELRWNIFRLCTETPARHSGLLPDIHREIIIALDTTTKGASAQARSYKMATNTELRDRVKNAAVCQ
ncbi:uncharacterized protein LOC116849569 [Odontomachus brunneus]|uniref:uncharacterized protein LOC116849569 n=1 Tax=Odontomachus brunneus TaxID=486640 RepID=UPI0013F1F4DC|nr:uncharacterized protein LOC116849569 [Odontomachus brunneus]